MEILCGSGPRLFRQSLVLKRRVRRGSANQGTTRILRLSLSLVPFAALTSAVTAHVTSEAFPEHCELKMARGPQAVLARTAAITANDAIASLVHRLIERTVPDHGRSRATRRMARRARFAVHRPLRPEQFG
jgi:hypothetical protein